MSKKRGSFIAASTELFVIYGTIIVVATHRHENLTGDGWFISDFYAFNYLKGLGSGKKWLTSN